MGCSESKPTAAYFARSTEYELRKYKGQLNEEELLDVLKKVLPHDASEQRRQAVLGIKDADGQTPLHLAIKAKADRAVWHLLSYGAPTEKLNSKNIKPLHLAMQEGNTVAFQLLLCWGADDKIQGRSLYHHIRTRMSKEEGEPFLKLLGDDLRLYCDEGISGCSHCCKNHSEDANKAKIRVAKLIRKIERSKNPVLVLSLDGGGIKGMCTCLMLEMLAKYGGRCIAKYGPSIFGISIGGLIAAGLGNGYSESQILGLMAQYKDRIFPGKRLHDPKPIEEIMDEVKDPQIENMSDFDLDIGIPISFIAEQPSRLHMHTSYGLSTIYDLDRFVRHFLDEFSPGVVIKYGCQGMAYFWQDFDGNTDAGLHGKSPPGLAAAEMALKKQDILKTNEMEGTRYNWEETFAHVSVGTGEPATKKGKDMTWGERGPFLQPEGKNLCEDAIFLSGSLNSARCCADATVYAGQKDLFIGKTWTEDVGARFFRFSPTFSKELSSIIDMDTVDEEILLAAMWETWKYCHREDVKMEMLEVAEILKAIYARQLENRKASQGIH